MSGIRPQALSDDEFVHTMYQLLNQANALPREVQEELKYRIAHGGRNPEKQLSANDPRQLRLFP